MANKNNETGFTNSQVGALIESFESKLSVLAEGFGTMSSDIRVLKEDVSELKTDMRLVKDAIRVAIPDHEKRITRLELKAAG